MESLAEEPWDLVICGTGLPQSLLALALSRSNKRVLHIDPNDYYGGHEAAFSMQEAENWVASLAGDSGRNLFRYASIWKHDEAASLGLSFPRAYSLALAPQIIHSRSRLLEQLVSSKAFRQVEFLAVGSFFVYDGSDGDDDGDGDGDGAATTTDSDVATRSNKLTRIPSSREDVFAARSIPARSKRSLMKFLKFAVDYKSEEHVPVWEGQAGQPLTEFLNAEFKLDETLRRYILALTLSLDDRRVSVGDGLAVIHRHLTSMGFFGPGFCAVYPKWGGLSEVAQVACRAGAVGGGVYMLGTDGAQVDDDASDDDGRVPLKLSNDVTVRTSAIVSSRQQEASPGGPTIERLVAVVNSPLHSLFEVLVEGSPVPAVAVVAFPTGSIADGDGDGASSPSTVYAFVHSSDTGECPSGQSVIYLTSASTAAAAESQPHSRQILDRALELLLRAAAPRGENPATALFKLRYVQSLGADGDGNGNGNGSSERETSRDGSRGGDGGGGAASSFSFPPPSPGLSFDDGCLDAVKAAWKLVMGDGVPEDQYMVFPDREGVGDDDGGDAAAGIDDVYD